MKLLKKGNGLDDIFKSKGKQSPLVIVAVIVVIAIALFFVGRNFIGGGGGDAPTDSLPATANGAAAGQPSAAQPTAAGATSHAGMHAGKPTASLAHPHPVMGAQAKHLSLRGAHAAKAPAVPVKLQSVTVFESVVVSYPPGWGLKIGGASNTALFTNGKGCFEVHAPDPTATKAKDIAVAALQTLGKGASVVAEGPDKVNGNDSYVYEIRSGSQQMRIIGVDAPTRIVVREYVRGGSLSSYKDQFELIHSKLSFK